MFCLNSSRGKKKNCCLFQTLIYVNVREGLAAIAASQRLLWHAFQPYSSNSRENGREKIPEIQRAAIRRAETLPKLTRFCCCCCRDETQKNMFVVGSYLDNAARMVAAAFQSNQNKPAHTHTHTYTSKSQLLRLCSKTKACEAAKILVNKTRCCCCAR